GPEQARDRVAEGCPAAGRHEHARVAAAHDLVAGGRRLTPELLIGEDIVEDIEGGGRGCGGHTATLVHAPDTKLHAPDTKRAEAGTAPAARLRDCWRLGAAVQGAGGC